MPNPFGGPIGRVKDQATKARGVSAGARRSAPAGPMPPDLANILLWIDTTDIGTLWQDGAGIIPAVDGLAVKRFDNKGSMVGVPFIHNPETPGLAPPILLVDEPVVGTGAVGVKTGGSAWNISNALLGGAPAAPASGLTVMGVGRQNDVAFASNTIAGWSSIHIVDNDGDTSGNWKVNSHTGSNIDTLVASPVNTWNYAYWAHDGGTDLKYRVGGIAEQTAVTPIWTPINAGQTVGLAGFRAQWSQLIMWSGQLSLADRIALVDYLDTVYGVLPF